MGAGPEYELSADLEAFLTHWQSARHGELVPTLSDYLDLPAISQLRDTAILDILPSGEMRYRLFGGGMDELFGADMTGRPVPSHFHPDAWTKAEKILVTSIAQPCGYLAQRQMRRGTLEVTTVGLGLPLRNTKTGQFCVVAYTSSSSRQTELAPSQESFYIVDVELLQWIDIGAGVPAPP